MPTIWLTVILLSSGQVNGKAVGVAADEDDEDVEVAVPFVVTVEPPVAYTMVVGLLMYSTTSVTVVVMVPAVVVVLTV